MSETEQINYRVHTSCKNCFFAEYNGKTQENCGLNLIDKYRQVSDNIVLECYDNNEEFFVINNKFCLYFIEKNRLAENAKVDEVAKAIRNHIKIRYHMIIVLNDKLRDLRSTLKSIASQKHPPVFVTIIKLPDNKIKGSAIVDLFHKIYSKKKETPKWRVQNALNPELTVRDYIDITIDGTKNKFYNFYSVINAGCILPKNFGSKLDEMINDEMKTFFLIKGNEEGNGMVVPLSVHLGHSGNSHGIYLETKVESDLCDNNKILEIKQIFPESF